MQDFWNMNKGIMFLLLLLGSQAQGQEHAPVPSERFCLNVLPTWFAEDQTLSNTYQTAWLHHMGRSKWNLGMEWDVVASEHPHHALAMVAEWCPLQGVHVAAAPGFVVDRLGASGVSWGWNAHVVWAHHIMHGHLDVGPMLDVGHDIHGDHVAVGITMGLPASLPRHHED